jgi:hypothetical protein
LGAFENNGIEERLSEKENGGGERETEFEKGG